MKFKNVEFNDGHLRFQFVNSQEAEYDPAQEFYNEWYKLQTIQEEKERREKEREKFLKKCEEEINAEYEKTIRELVASSGYSIEPDMNYFKTLKNGFLLKDVNDKFYLFFNMEKNKISKFKMIKETADAYIVKSSRTNKLGVLDKECKIIVPTEYSYISENENGYIVTKRRGNIRLADLEGVYDKQGKIILPIKEWKIRKSKDGCYIVKQWNEEFKMGLFSSKGKVIIPFKYRFIREAENGYIVEGELGEQGVYNNQGKIIISPKYWDIEDTKNGYIVEKLEHGEEWRTFPKTLKGLYDIKGKIILPIKNWDIKYMGDGYIVRDNSRCGKSGVMDLEGKFIIPMRCNRIEETKEGYIVRATHLVGVFDKKGKKIIPIEYDEVFEEKNGYRVLKGKMSDDFKRWKFGFYNDQGKLIIPLMSYEQFEKRYQLYK